jgi:hypothetical protein
MVPVSTGWYRPVLRFISGCIGTALDRVKERRYRSVPAGTGWYCASTARLYVGSDGPRKRATVPVGTGWYWLVLRI